MTAKLIKWSFIAAFLGIVLGGLTTFGSQQTWSSTKNSPMKTATVSDPLMGVEKVSLGEIIERNIWGVKDSELTAFQDSLRFVEDTEEQPEPEFQNVKLLGVFKDASDYVAWVSINDSPPQAVKAGNDIGNVQITRISIDQIELINSGQTQTLTLFKRDKTNS